MPVKRKPRRREVVIGQTPCVEGESTVATKAVSVRF
jgi:hypothetical protein